MTGGQGLRLRASDCSTVSCLGRPGLDRLGFSCEIAVPGKPRASGLGVERAAGPDR